MKNIQLNQKLNKIVKVATLIFYSAICFSQDIDNDGLLDSWETSGIGPINPRIHNIKPNHADMFLLIAFRSRTDSIASLPAIEKVKDFYARLPNRNIDGTTGVNIVIVYGNRLSSALDATPYNELYNQSTPVAWRNYAHTYLLEPGGGGGGQTSGRISASGYNWAVMVHEIGHQLGLNHTPPNGIQSPFYTSLMNYDYSYSFGGSTENIQFSNGQFESQRIIENNLNENINVPLSSLQFLTESPYNYTVRPITSAKSTIDWNRNGIFSETNVKADINDGYGVKIGNATHLNATSGSPSLASVGSNLYLIYPKIDGTAPSTWNSKESDFSAGSPPVRLYFQRKTIGGFTTESRLSPQIVTSQVSSIGFKGRLFVGHTIVGGYPKVTMWSVGSNGALHSSRATYNLTTKANQVVFANTGLKIPAGRALSPLEQGNEKLWALTWSDSTKKINISQVKINTNATGDESINMNTEAAELEDRITSTSKVIPIISNTPIGVSFDRNTQMLLLLVTDESNNLKLISLKYFKIKGWQMVASEWVANRGSITTNVAPTILLDNSANRNSNPVLTIFVKGIYNGIDHSQIFRFTKTQDLRENGGWRRKLVRDDWTTTLSAPAITLHQNDLFFALRWCCGEHVLHNKIVLFDKAHSIENDLLSDFNDINHIATVGLKNFIIR